MAHRMFGSTLLLAFLATAVACGSSSSDSARSESLGGTGGSSASATGGRSGSSGNTGGSTEGQAGSGDDLTGGKMATGGATSTGGSVATGGAIPTGGNLAAGGTIPTGGSRDTGGTGSGTADTGGTGSGGIAETGGTPDTGGTGTVQIDPDGLFVAPNGNSGASGTIDDPTTLPDALSRVAAGDTIYMRAGTYPFSSPLTLSSSGTADLSIQLRAYPRDGERPLIDFSSMSENSSNRGLSLSGDYWHVYGIDVYGAGDNCLFVKGSHNTIEYSTFSECADTGLQLGNGAADNLILNCDSYFNADSSLENADGFAAKLDVGTGNRFIGCRAWNNLDDGWDGYLRGADNVTTSYENCWAIDNGKLKNGSVGVGDGNGFKTGGSDGKDLSHGATYKQCIAAGNVHDGFDHNSNRGHVTILNCAAHDNGSNINFGAINIAAALTIKNTISLGTNGELSATSTDITNNSWQGLSATKDDFVSVDTALLKAPRNSDGSLPDIDYLQLTAGSDLRNAGVDVGLPFNGSMPDIGPFESDE